MSYEKWAETVEGVSALAHCMSATTSAALVDRCLRAAYRTGVKDGAEAMLKTEMDGPDLALLAKVLHCGPSTPYAKLLEVAEGAVEGLRQKTETLST